MATTTMAAITAKQRAIIAALVPTKSIRRRFEQHAGRRDFIDWAETNPGRCLRAFEVIDTGEASVPDVSDLNVALELGTSEVTIAYPHQWADYGRDNRRAMEAMIEADMRQVDDAIGLNGIANYLPGQCKAIGAARVVEGDGVTFSVLRYEIEYYRSVSP